MNTHAVESFFNTLADVFPERWTQDALREVSRLDVPSVVFGANDWLLKADHATTVARWFVEGLVDLAPYEFDDSLNIGHLYKELITQMRSLTPAPDDEVRKAARKLASFAWHDVILRRNMGRKAIRKRLREEVWFREEPNQRCYLCGYKFTPLARDLFLHRTAGALTPRNLVDFTRPRGRSARHLAVEVDHVMPVIEGGATDIDNLRLACGWCNIVKSRYCAIYDAKSWSVGVVSHPILGHVSVPQPLWLLRLVAIRGRCEERSSCQARLADHELFVAPRSPKGALTPTNLMVVCQDHDPWRHQRLVNPALLPA